MKAELNPQSLASVMHSINDLGVTHADLVALRKRAVALALQDTRVRSAASVALIFLGGIQQGGSAAEMLKADSRQVLKLARKLEAELHGHAAQRR